MSVIFVIQMFKEIVCVILQILIGLTFFHFWHYNLTTTFYEKIIEARPLLYPSYFAILAILHAFSSKTLSEAVLLVQSFKSQWAMPHLKQAIPSLFW